jgi:hypothetical protein
MGGRVHFRLELCLAMVEIGMAPNLLNVGAALMQELTKRASASENS